MIHILNVQTLSKERVSISALSDQEETIDGSHLTALPALIDPHVHFRTPGAEYKENWISGTIAALSGGVTTVLDMPNNSPSCTTLSSLEQKMELTESQIKKSTWPLRAYYYLGVSKTNLYEIPSLAPQIAGLKLFLGSSTGDLLVTDPFLLKDIFDLAASLDLLIAVHAEDDALISANKKTYATHTDPKAHSLIRNPKAAALAVERAIELAANSRARLYLAHISTQDELVLIRNAKQDGICVYAEASPHHLFLDTSAYEKLGTQAVVNPPLRDQSDVKALWQAISDKTIDTIGTDHAPHTLEEKLIPYPNTPSGMPSIEFYLALLLDAASKGTLSLERIVELTSESPRKIFRLSPHQDLVLVDLNRKETITSSMIRSKAGWSPYLGSNLQGWPIYTICRGKIFVAQFV